MQNLIEPKDWFVRVGNADNYKKTTKYNVWGVKPTDTNGMHMFKTLSPGDKLWFVKNQYKEKDSVELIKGHILGCATYVSQTVRDNSVVKLVEDELTNEDLKWDNEYTDHTRIHYTNHYDIEPYKIYVKDLTRSCYTNNIKPSGEPHMDLKNMYKHVIIFVKATNTF